MGSTTDSETSRSLYYRLRGMATLFIFYGGLLLALVGMMWGVLAVYYRAYISLSILIGLLIYQYNFAKPWPEMTRLFPLRYSHQYFDDWQLTARSKIDEKKSLISIHPHGIFNLGLTFNNTAYFNCTVLSSRALLLLPLTGILLRWWNVRGVNKHNFLSLMKREKNIGFIPGGFEEATMTSNKVSRIFIKKRKGFIKYALQFGYKIYPGFVFGESKTYSVYEGHLKFRLFLNKFKIPGVAFLSKMGLFPDPFIKVHTIIDTPIELPRIERPSEEDINKYHQIYIEKIKALYYDNRSLCGYEDQELEIY